LKLKKISIENFRNITDIEYEAVNGLNIFMGENAQGKTNIIEAIFMMATGNSFRTSNDKLMVKYESACFQIAGKHQFENRLIDTGVYYHLNKGKTIKINNKKTTQNNTNRLRVVVFTPDDLYLVKGSPSRRRIFVDIILREVSAEYRLLLENYNKVLRKRNDLLRKDKSNTRNYSVINELFIEYSVKIITSRINFVNLLDKLVKESYTKINKNDDEIKLKYALSFPVQDDKENKQTLTDNLYNYLADKKENELRKKRSIAGPHLDDINIYLNNKPARLYASQGQQRNIAVSLKLAEIYAFKELCGFYPVFMLDEVLAELDDIRKVNLLEEISKGEYQSFLTSVSNENLKKVDGIISIVKNGQIERKE